MPVRSDPAGLWKLRRYRARTASIIPVFTGRRFSVGLSQTADVSSIPANAGARELIARGLFDARFTVAADAFGGPP
jgi:hypothetical protein